MSNFIWQSAIIVTHFVPVKINFNCTGQLEMSLVASNDTSNTWYLKLTGETPSERCTLNTWSDKLAGSNTAAYQIHANSLASVRLTHDWGSFIVGHRLSLLLRYVNKQTVLALISEWRLGVTQKWRNVSMRFLDGKKETLRARHEVAHWHSSDKMSDPLWDESEREEISGQGLQQV